MKLFESFIESLIFLKATLDGVRYSIGLARLRIVHTSIIILRIGKLHLRNISCTPDKNPNLPISITTVSQYLDPVEIEAYQTDSKIVLIPKMSLMDRKT